MGILHISIKVVYTFWVKPLENGTCVRKCKVLVVGRRDERNFHLEALSAIAKIVMDPRFDDKWLRARSVKALKALLLNADRNRRLPES
ncbi:hypothetical protein [Desulfobacter latus]|uniref:PTS EIIA type-2 domain-containing protein n=1 Tax=Desulfobacter latus TaxID=2292 RepID=A0A850TEM5_9BACT|nr:hypothetical protein [Desulfobacter latus]NWH06737.1 hypothetical protein [Desulfobacter latus]